MEKSERLNDDSWRKVEDLKNVWIQKLFLSLIIMVVIKGHKQGSQNRYLNRKIVIRFYIVFTN